MFVVEHKFPLRHTLSVIIIINARIPIQWMNRNSKHISLVRGRCVDRYPLPPTWSKCNTIKHSDLISWSGYQQRVPNQPWQCVFCVSVTWPGSPLSLSRVAVVSKSFEGQTNKTEEWYGTQYKQEAITDTTIEVNLYGCNALVEPHAV